MPDDEALAERAQARLGLTRPEIAVLFSTCKIWLADEVLKSDLPDDPHLADDIVRYFPTPIRSRFRAAIAGHRLRRELIATMITNSLINRVGGTFVTDIAEKTGAAPIDIARAYIVARDVFGVRAFWHGIEALDGRVRLADADPPLPRRSPADRAGHAVVSPPRRSAARHLGQHRRLRHRGNRARRAFRAGAAGDRAVGDRRGGAA